MAQVTKTPGAIRDLDRIVRHIAHDNLSAAIAWLQNTERLFNLLAEQPGLGQSVISKRFGPLRRQVTGSYLIYYREIPGGGQIIRVVHGARDQRKLI